MITSIHKPVTGLLVTTLAALFVQIGSAAAASPPSDFQQQVRRVVAGTGASRSAPHAVPADVARPGRDGDAQAFVQRLLLGVTAAPPATLHAARRPAPAAGLQLARNAAAADPQASVRRLLLGRDPALRGAL
jgi:hypothetical protein